MYGPWGEAPDCTCGVIDPLYHSRHNGGDRQYECDRGITLKKCILSSKNKDLTGLLQTVYGRYTITIR